MTTIHTEKHPRTAQRLRWGLSCANGYFELGMLSKAERELTELGFEWQEKPAVMALRLRILLAKRSWTNVIEVAERAVHLFPHVPEFYVHAAAAYDMTGQSETGRKMWQAAPENVRSSGVLHFHVARFEASLGNLVAAREHLQRAFTLDPALLAIAGKDPSLAQVLSDQQRN